MVVQSDTAWLLEKQEIQCAFETECPGQGHPRSKGVKVQVTGSFNVAKD